MIVSSLELLSSLWYNRIVGENMKTRLSRQTTIKLALGIAIPVLVLVVTICMLGVSFAWFSMENTLYVESITITAEAAYKVGFDTTSAGNNLLYRGQTAMKSGGIIINDPSDARKDDRPYCFATLINFNTKGANAEIAISFDYARIYEEVGEDKTKQTINEYGEGKSNSEDMIPYVFTWFFKAHTGGAGTQSTNMIDPTADEEDRDMIYYTPIEDEIWYTPYGVLTFGENSIVKAINGDTDNVDMPLATRSFTLLTGDDGALYDFYIVFAPEKLFWAQFFNNTKGATAISIYRDSNQTTESGTTNPVINHIAGNPIGSTSMTCNSVYYSGYRYLGSIFQFTAVIDVIDFVKQP